MGFFLYKRAREKECNMADQGYDLGRDANSLDAKS